MGKSAPVERVDWSDSFIDSTHHLIDVLRQGGQPRLDGPDGKTVLRFSLAALESARSGKEICPGDLG